MVLSRRRREDCVRLCVWLWVARVADSFACSWVHENQVVLDKNLRRRQLLGVGSERPRPSRVWGQCWKWMAVRI